MHRREEEERRMHDDEAELLDRLTEKERREAFEWSYENKKNSTHHEEEIQELLAAEQRDGLIQAEKLHEAEYHAHLKSQEKEAGAIRMDEDSQYHSSIPQFTSQGSTRPNCEDLMGELCLGCSNIVTAGGLHQLHLAPIHDQVTRLLDGPTKLVPSNRLQSIHIPS